MNTTKPQQKEPHTDRAASSINWLRAAVLGANDGIVSLSALVVGIAGASVSSGTILITGVAGLLAGASSMAVGEYVSVSSQRDTEHALLEKERRELEHFPESELEELVGLYEKKGLSSETARVVAKELTAHDAFAAHVSAELNIDPNNLTNPVQAGIASALAFSSGAVIPLLAITLAPTAIRIQVTFIATILALLITGTMSAKISGVRTWPVVVRMLLGGVLAMVITLGVGYGIGKVGL
jgi:VIT1/CCC1 family predicted Fe2+/Mn2+ transporter